MWKSKTIVKKTQSLNLEELYYDEDFEEIEEEDFGKIGDGQFIEDESSSTTTTTTKSETPESQNNDSIGDTLNTNNSNLREEDDYEYDYGDEEYSKSFDLQSFHETLAGMNFPRPKLYKNGTRASLTFSNDRVREIERHNQLLLNKIMQNGPADDGFVKPKVKSKAKKPAIRSSAEVNRRKQQAKIDYENAILKKKLDKIAFRRPSLS